MIFVEWHLASSGDACIIRVDHISEVTARYVEADKDFQARLYMSNGTTIDICEFYRTVWTFLRNVMEGG